MLHGVGAVSVPARACALTPPLRQVLDRVGAGEDTLDVLLADGDQAETLLALGELEARGLLARGASGCYLARA
ncbi:MAG: hypothetical protein ACYCU0_15825 [Solirubrobacteraceae bacterium]